MAIPVISRRRLLGGIALGTTGVVAGCSEDSSGETQNNDSPDGTGETGSENGNDTEDGQDSTGGEDGDTADGDDGDTADGDDGELDFREANVVAVAFERDGDSYTFDVTLHHDDDGEDGYANWWQVEQLDGTQLGRRDLLHAHSRQPFTRSETVTIPDGVRCVVVRGHDQTHGYGGQAMVVDLESSAMRASDQGLDPQSFDESDCP